MCDNIWIIVILLITIGFKLNSSVKITRFNVPSRVSHSALLDCKYDLEGEQLYDVTWYKDEQQFFRCMPNGKVLPYFIESVKLDYSENSIIGSCQVTLIALTAKSSGIYKCEVITERPTFNSDSKSTYLGVEEAPLATQQEMYDYSTDRSQNQTEKVLTSSATQYGSVNGFQLVQFQMAILLRSVIFKIL